MQVIYRCNTIPASDSKELLHFNRCGVPTWPLILGAYFYTVKTGGKADLVWGEFKVTQRGDT